MRLINRDDAIHAFDSCLGMNRAQAQDIIAKMPEVDAEPLKQGHWIDDNGIYAWCSCCKEHIYQTGEFKYCPNCGAKMESEE